MSTWCLTPASEPPPAMATGGARLARGRRCSLRCPWRRRLICSLAWAACLALSAAAWGAAPAVGPPGAGARTAPALWLGAAAVAAGLAAAAAIGALWRRLQRSRARERALAEQVQRWSLALEIAGHAVWDWHLPQQRFRGSPGWDRLLGAPAGRADPAAREARIHPDDLARVQGLLQELVSGARASYQSEHRMRTDDGREIWVLERARLVERDLSMRPTRIVATVEDITERRANLAHIEFLASHDALTGLPNRSLLADRVGQALARADRQQHLVAVIFVDLDHFKVVNDTLGHDAGDQLLVRVAAALSSVLRRMDTLSRRGGDEFVVLLPEVHSPAEAATVCAKLQACLGTPFRLQDRDVHVSASMGVALYPVDASSTDSLLQLADAAMYRAKQQGRRCYSFHAAEMNHSMQSDMDFEIRLRRAMAQGFLSVWYQPRYSLRSGQVVGAQALLHWIEPDGTTVAPEVFVPLAERLGLIQGIGEWVLFEACRQALAWHRLTGRRMPVAVQLSARQARQPGLSAVVARALADVGAAADHLILELSESVLLADEAVTRQTLAALVQQGVRLAVDDFGGGLASLATLKRVPIDHLKMARSHVLGLDTDDDNETLLHGLVQLGHSLNLAVVAQGVETERQAALLKAHDCDIAQGAHYGRPLPDACFAALLATAGETAEA